MKYLAPILWLLSLNTSADIATFAGGCFWCSESDFEQHKGISKVISGYAGGLIKSPSYEMVSGGKTKYREAVQVTFDPKRITYEELLTVFWMHIDPTDTGGQFVDRGLQYSSAIFYHNDTQKKSARRSKKILIDSKLFKKKIFTPIEKFTNFYPAEEYHQDFYKKNLKSKLRYKAYRMGSGRDSFIKKHWTRNPFTQKRKTFMKPSKEELKKMLTPLQYKVTQKDGTEKPFDNEYWDNKEEGIYIDRVSREPLFSSTHKYKSGTGWPSFWQPIEKDNIIEKEDRKLFSVRTEVRSKQGDSHLGHVFSDGPQPTGLRYCMNSAAMIFIPKDKMKEEGFEQYLHFFK